MAVARWGFAGSSGPTVLRVEERGADHGHPNGRDDLLARVDRRIDNEVQEVLPRRREDRAVLRIGDFDDDALAGRCRAALRELDVPVEVAGSFFDVPCARPSGDLASLQLGNNAEYDDSKQPTYVVHRCSTFLEFPPQQPGSLAITCTSTLIH